MPKSRTHSTRPKTGLQRGTTGYAINFVRSDIMVNLQLDLKRLEQTGITEETCKKIRELLSALVTAASSEPKASFWQPAVHTVFRDYENIYKHWNDVKGTDEAAIRRRDELLSDLQDVRHKISNICRQSARSLSEVYDLELVENINDALRDTISVVPGTFTALAKSAARFSARAL